MFQIRQFFIFSPEKKHNKWFQIIPEYVRGGLKDNRKKNQEKTFFSQYILKRFSFYEFPFSIATDHYTSECMAK